MHSLASTNFVRAVWDVRMEALARLAITEQASGYGWRQRTLKSAIGCTGIGVHTGQRVNLTISPADPDSGIVLLRSDLGRPIQARYDLVADTRLCTVLADPNDPAIRVGTVEHLLAALSGAGIDNALITLDGPEVPILDGSAAPFLFLLDCAGWVEQDAARQIVQVRQTIRVTDGDAWAELRPLGTATRTTGAVLEMDLSIDFAAGAIGRQASSLRLTPDTFRHQLAQARTFALAGDVQRMQAAGLALGGSLDNAVVVDGDTVLNPGGLRMDNEFASHKLLDAVGDLALAGGRLHGRFVAHRTGHALNNRLLRTLFADPDASQDSETAPLIAAA
jgi:UDP-3-O-[3-hydroxymyristoyl] N-acetylglucosamine deacetylase